MTNKNSRLFSIARVLAFVRFSLLVGEREQGAEGRKGNRGTVEWGNPCSLRALFVGSGSRWGICPGLSVSVAPNYRPWGRVSGLGKLRLSVWGSRSPGDGKRAGKNALDNARHVGGLQFLPVVGGLVVIGMQ